MPNAPKFLIAEMNNDAGCGCGPACRCGDACRCKDGQRYGADCACTN